MEITERIFALLEKQGKKQSDFARFLNVRDATISDWKRKRSTPSATILAMIAEYFGITIDFLCTGKEPTPTDTAIKQGIFGNSNQYNTVTIHGNGIIEISEFDGELIKVCGRLDMRRKNALLTYAYDLEKQVNEKK